MFQKLDHIAIAVKDTEEALGFYRDTLRLPVLVSEVLEEVGVRLTHLDMGNVELQLVEPLNDAHPIAKFIEERGEGMHHLCWQVEDLFCWIRVTDPFFAGSFALNMPQSDGLEFFRLYQDLQQLPQLANVFDGDNISPWGKSPSSIRENPCHPCHPCHPW